MMTLMKIAKADKEVSSINVLPSAVPLAGGCSKSIMTVIKIMSPTEHENHSA
jgi:hypothetical protein